MAKPSTFAVFEIDGYLVFRRRLLSLPEIKSGYIGDGDRQGLDSKECFQRALPRAISAHPDGLAERLGRKSALFFGRLSVF